jgi:hypothetical protein
VVGLWIVAVMAAVAVGAFAFHFSRAGQTGRLAADTTHAPLLGASVSAADIAQETSEFGHMGIVRVYYPGLPSSNAWTTGLAAASKSPVIVSFKALPTAILSGRTTRRSHSSSTPPPPGTRSTGRTITNPRGTSRMASSPWPITRPPGRMSPRSPAPHITPICIRR